MLKHKQKNKFCKFDSYWLLRILILSRPTVASSTTHLESVPAPQPL